MAEETDGEKLGPWWLNWAIESSHPQVHPNFGPLDFLSCERIYFHIEARLSQGFWSQIDGYCFWSLWWNQCARDLWLISYVCLMEVWTFASLCPSFAYSILMTFFLPLCGDLKIHPGDRQHPAACWKHHMGRTDNITCEAHLAAACAIPSISRAELAGLS